jgi:sugar fermentation stimulation protein A
MQKYLFEKPLQKALILSRPNRFIMIISLKGKTQKAHCPATGRIGDIVFKNIFCLVSKSENKKRKTNYTVEAISINSKNNDWIGINQTSINKYVEFFLKSNQLNKIIKFKELKREVRIGKSRIDFALDNNLFEVKMPLIALPKKINLEKKEKQIKNLTSFDRLIKHFNELSKSLKNNSRAIILNCYEYDAQPFNPPKPDKKSIKIQEAARSAIKKGVEMWQANFKIDEKGIKIIKYFKLNLFKQF